MDESADNDISLQVACYSCNDYSDVTDIDQLTSWFVYFSMLFSSLTKPLLDICLL